MRNQDAVGARQASGKSRQILLERPGVREIIDPGEAVVGRHTGGPQALEKQAAKKSDKGSLPPGKSSASQLAQRKVRVPDVRTPGGRQARDKIQKSFPHAQELVNVQVPINEVRPSP